MSAILYPLSVSVVSTYTPSVAYAYAYSAVLDGDDLTANAGQWGATFIAANGAQVPALTLESFLFGTNAVATSVAVAGQTLSTMTANASANVDSKIAGGKTNFLLVQGGNADAVAGASGATIAGRMGTYVAARKAAGWSKVVVVGLLQSAGNASVNAAANAAIRAGWRGYGADAFADVAADQVLGVAGLYSDRRWFLTDSLTLTPNGAIRYADKILGAVKSALGL